MKKFKNFNIIWRYLKDEKIKIFLYIFLIIITYTPVLASAYFFGKSVEYLIAYNYSSFIKFLFLWEGLYIICYALLRLPCTKIYNELEIKFMQNVSNDLYKKINKLPAKAFEEIGVGEFINRLYNDTDRVMELLSNLVRLICKSLVVIAVLVVCFKISYILFIEIIVFSIIMGIISTVFLPKIKKTQEGIKKESDEYVKVATENITGIREIKALGIKSNVEDNLANRISKMVGHIRKQKSYSNIYYSTNNFIYFILQFIILFTTGTLFIKGKIVFSMFSMIESYIWRIDEIVESISDFGVNYNKVSVSLKRISEILDNKLYKDEKYGNVNLKNTKGIIEFKDVQFHYSEDEDDTLKGLNLKIDTGKKIAVVGKSGNGKSTIFNLLLRYFDANKGQILIDDIDIKELTEDSLRNNISIIRQSPFLFNMSIIDNFKIVKPNTNLEEIKKVCKNAYIDDYIMSLPQQYETIIGEGGINLSGGQKQRIAIARTLLLNTKIILFDEATSALDNESQNYIKKTIDDLVKDHTIIIVAHRLSTIIDAEIINVIDKGKLAASGTHEELIKNNKIYQGLYNSENMVE